MTLVGVRRESLLVKVGVSVDTDVELGALWGKAGCYVCLNYSFSHSLIKHIFTCILYHLLNRVSLYLHL